jgi:hypothetical protein
MFYMGGEQELAEDGLFKSTTNSGRSSLRLILESANLRNKKVLFPDFFCEVIMDIFKEYQIEFGFYHIKDNFQICLPDDSEKYDALYLIKFFGGITDSFTKACSSFQSCIIIDDVFSPYPQALTCNTPWYSFNSLRKISPISDFSLVYSNHPLKPINAEYLDEFSILKYQAKKNKFEYLHNNQGNEEEYLRLFTEAEDILSNSKGIFTPSTASMVESLRFFSKLENETEARKTNYQLINQLLPNNSVNIDASFYSFAPVFLTNRDEIRSELMKKNIFLAVHWPSSKVIKNTISQSIISIPVDSRYSVDEIKSVCNNIKLMEYANGRL